jgi:hypothetical protein
VRLLAQRCPLANLKYWHSVSGRAMGPRTLNTGCRVQTWGSRDLVPADVKRCAPSCGSFGSPAFGMHHADAPFRN